MDVDAFLADAVESVNGKLYALGAGWNVVGASRLPVRHARLALGILVHVPYTETNEEHRLRVRLEDADGHILPIGDAPGGPPGKKVYEIATNITVGRPPQLKPGDDQVVPTAVTIDGLIFEKADRYRFVVAIDDVDLKVLPLRVLVSGSSK